jgi:uncharacterized protein YegL
MSSEHPEGFRRLPVYLLLDCSGSMAGEPIMAMQMGVRSLVNDLVNDPYALETVWLSVITFSSHVDQLVPLTDVSDFHLAELEATGTTALGEALELLMDCIKVEVRHTTPEHKGDWRPMAFLFTDGEPTDSWQKAAERFHREGPATLIVCGAGPEVKDDTLQRLSDTVVRLTDTQPGTLGRFMKWVTASVTAASKSLGADGRAAPALPKFDGEAQSPTIPGV